MVLKMFCAFGVMSYSDTTKKAQQRKYVALVSICVCMDMYVIYLQKVFSNVKAIYYQCDKHTNVRRFKHHLFYLTCFFTFGQNPALNSSVASFDQFGLHKELLTGLAQLNYRRPTTVQVLP